MKSVLAVIAAASATLIGAPALAQSQPHYSATLEAAPGQARFVTRSTIWNCAGNTCTASRATSRDQVMCELVARHSGTLTAFSAGGQAFDAEALSKCNSRAK